MADTTQERFLAGFRENPSDDETRLIYADWLQDNGPEEVANLWRTEVALRQAQRASADTTKELKAYQAAFAEVKDMPEYCAALKDTVINDEGFLVIPVTQFYNHAYTLTETLGFRSVKLQDLPQESSRAYYSRYFANKAFSNLERLDLGGCYISTAGVQALAASQTLGNLRYLDVGYNSIGDVGATALADAETLVNLEHLDLSHNLIRAEGAQALAASPHLARLRSLDLRENRIQDAGAAALAESAHLAGLRSLDLAWNAIGDAGVQALAASQTLRNLEFLSLSNNYIGPEGATALAASQTLGNLRHLDVGYNSFGNAGAAALAGSAHLAGLRSLDLAWNAIGDAGRQALQEAGWSSGEGGRFTRPARTPEVPGEGVGARDVLNGGRDAQGPGGVGAG